MAPLPESGDTTRLREGRCVLSGCGRRFQYDPEDLSRSSFPFCSLRCKGVDLGGWVYETYRVEGLAGDEPPPGVAADDPDGYADVDE